MVNLLALLGLDAVLAAVTRIEDKLNKQGVTMARVDAQLDAIQAKLDEASTEIPQLIQDLRDALGEASPEVQAKLNALDARASSLAGIVQNAAPEAPVDPEPTPAEEGDGEAFIPAQG